MNINGKKAVVVGGASGMARATAEQLSECGAQVAILDLPTSAFHARHQLGSALEARIPQA